MKEFLVQRWFLLALALILTAGLAFPHPLWGISSRVPQDLVTAAVSFVMALSLDAHTMWQALRRPTAVALAVGINFGLLPLVAWGVAQALYGDLASGLLIAASAPCTMASAAVWTRRAGGNDAVALLVTMTTNVACFVVTPLWLLATTGRDIGRDRLLEMMVKLAVVVVLPTLAAQLLRLYRPLGAWAVRKKLFVSLLAQCGILSIVFVGAVNAGLTLADQSSGQSVSGPDWAAMLASVLGVHLAMLWAGHALGRFAGLPRPDRIAVGFSGSQKTQMIGLYIALNYYGGLAMLPMVAYHVGQLLVDTIVADRLKRPRGSEPAQAADPIPSRTSP